MNINGNDLALASLVGRTQLAFSGQFPADKSGAAAYGAAVGAISPLDDSWLGSDPRNTAPTKDLSSPKGIRQTHRQFEAAAAKQGEYAPKITIEQGDDKSTFGYQTASGFGAITVKFEAGSLMTVSGVAQIYKGNADKSAAQLREAGYEVFEGSA